MPLEQQGPDSTVLERTASMATSLLTWASNTTMS